MAVAASISSDSFSQEEVNENALDDFCDSVNTVAGRVGVELYDGWFYPLVAHTGAHRAGYQSGVGPPNGRLTRDPLTAIKSSFLIQLSGAACAPPSFHLGVDAVTMRICAGNFI